MTRRAFVATTSHAAGAAASLAAGSVLWNRPLDGQPLDAAIVRIADLGASSLSATNCLTDAIDAADLRRFATSAVDAAMRAGATYADCRIGEPQILDIWDWEGSWNPSVSVYANLRYGVRVLVDGAWAFAHGSVPTVDAITTSAREAVATAKGYASLVIHRSEMAPAPVVTGEWATPCAEDPFAVSLRDHAAMMSVYYKIVHRVRPQNLTPMIRFGWTKENRVFASSEGSLTTQRVVWVSPRIQATGAYPVVGTVNLRFHALPAIAGGFETVANSVKYEEAYLGLCEDIARYVMLPNRGLDVGRYPVVVDGATLGMLFGRTMGAALELDRVLGDEADASGVSYLNPPLELLGTSIANSQLTVTATRAVPVPSLAKWDDEGVESHPYTLIQDGCLVDYHTSRSTAPALRAWYERQGQPLRSRGCAVATTAGDPVTIRAPQLMIAPAQKSASIDALCAEVKDGVLLVGVEEFAVDQQFTSTTVTSSTDRGPDIGVFLKIEKGKIVARVQGNCLDMNMRKFWKEQLVAVGDASTVRHPNFMSTKGIPWRRTLQMTSAPAALFKDVNISSFEKNI
jgi:TldD protein